MSARYRVNWDGLLVAFEMARDIHGVSEREAAHLIGISPSSISRLRSGKHLSADAVAAMTAWIYPTSIPSWVTNQPEVTP